MREQNRSEYRPRLKALLYWGFLVMIPFFSYHLVFTCFPNPVWARRVFINQLVQDLIRLDGKEIEISGEVVGEIMERRNGVWLNMDDGTESIGVWASKEMLPKIDFIGRYGVKGDILSIKGVFNRACCAHGGETDIHAYAIKRLHVGYTLPHPISSQKVEWTLILFCLAMITVLIYWWHQRVSG